MIKQRVKKARGNEYHEYRCVWVGHEEADATWETEATLEKLKNGPEKLVSAACVAVAVRSLACAVSARLPLARCTARYRLNALSQDEFRTANSQLLITLAYEMMVEGQSSHREKS